MSAVREYLKEHTNPPVFISSAVIALAFVLVGIVFPGPTGDGAASVSTFVTTNFEWLYVFGASAFVIFVVYVMLSRFGSIRLGPNDSEPEYGNISWFAMLFTAGMGIGLVYYAVSEPITHFMGPPTGEGGTPQAAQDAMVYTFYHWGIHPWAIYLVLGLALGYFSFRRGLPLRPASALYPLLGERIYGWPGAVVDVLAVFGTLFGLATSLGIGGQQVGAGLETLFGVPNTVYLQVALIAAITAVAVVSVMLGVDKGIRNLSLANLWLAFGLMVFVFAFGPTRDLINVLATNVGNYAQTLPSLGFQTFPNGGSQAQDWQAGWTLFYWGWWISWSPFVGMFLARISYGRTIRSFLAGALLAPVGASMVWLTIFGDSALRTLLADPDNPLAEATPENGMFVLLDQLPVPTFVSLIASFLAIVVVVLFFATSSDSGSLVVDILTNGGDPNPKWQQRLFWALMEGLIAIVLLLAGAFSGADALGALQTASIVAGLPLAVVLVLMIVGLLKAFRTERFELQRIAPASPMAGLREASLRMAPPRVQGEASADEDLAEDLYVDAQRRAEDADRAAEDPSLAPADEADAQPDRPTSTTDTGRETAGAKD